MENLEARVRALAYWMSGSLRFAESLAEEAVLRAGRLPDLPVEAAARGAWLVGYAASRCLESLDGLPPRGLPAWLAPPREGAVPGPFLEPYPDELYPDLPGPGEGSAARFGGRESVSFALLASLQLLPVQARAALVLHDVMGMGLGELEGALRMSPSNLEDLLECARDALADAYDLAAGRREPPPGEHAARLSMRYIFHWEAGDVEGLAEMLSPGTLLQSVPSGRCYRGREAVRSHLAAGVLAGGGEEARGRWRLLPTRSNGQLAFGVYLRDAGRRVFEARSLQTIFIEDGSISEVICFDDPGLLPSFGLLPEVFVQG